MPFMATIPTTHRGTSPNTGEPTNLLARRASWSEVFQLAACSLAIGGLALTLAHFVLHPHQPPTTAPAVEAPADAPPAATVEPVASPPYEAPPQAWTDEATFRHANHAVQTYWNSPADVTPPTQQMWGTP